MVGRPIQGKMFVCVFEGVELFIVAFLLCVDLVTSSMPHTTFHSNRKHRTLRSL